MISIIITLIGYKQMYVAFMPLTQSKSKGENVLSGQCSKHIFSLTAPVCLAFFTSH